MQSTWTTEIFMPILASANNSGLTTHWPVSSWTDSQTNELVHSGSQFPHIQMRRKDIHCPHPSVAMVRFRQNYYEPQTGPLVRWTKENKLRWLSPSLRPIQTLYPSKITNCQSHVMLRLHMGLLMCKYKGMTQVTTNALEQHQNWLN